MLVSSTTLFWTDSLCFQDENGDLVNPAAPNLTKQSKLENQGLLIDGRADKSLCNSSDWTAAEVEEWLREKLPRPFKWLDANMPSSDPKYRLLIKNSTMFLLCPSTAPTGYDLNKYKGGSGKSWTARQIWLGALPIYQFLFPCH